MKKGYRKQGIISKVVDFFAPYLEGFQKQTAENVLWVLFAMIVLGSARSIRFLYEHFLKFHQEKTQNAFYGTFRYAKRPADLGFWKISAKLLLKCIPAALANAPILLIVDDTLIPKYGLKFEHVKILFDHADHSGRPYKNGHCFVTLMMSVPVGIGEDGMPIYLSIPLVHRIWISGKENPTKLEIAKGLVLGLKPILENAGTVIVLADCWYGKKPFFELRKEWKVDFCCGIRKDSALYELPPARTGKRGRPRKRGEKKSINDIELAATDDPDYIGGTCEVMTNLFDEPVTVCVSAKANGSGGKRLHVSTIADKDLAKLLKPDDPESIRCALLYLYVQRWGVEIGYLEQKGFWDMTKYMLRSARGIDLFLNLIAIAYSAMRMLPYLDEDLHDLRGCSPQEVRFEVGRRIQDQLFFGRLLRRLSETKFGAVIIKPLRRLIDVWDEAA